MKQVIVVRDDLGMSRGKMAAQCCHASLGAALKAKKKAFSEWQAGGGKKVVLRARDGNEIARISEKCAMARLPFYVVADAGLTEIEPGTITAIGIGPESDAKIDRITGSVPLLE